MSRLPAVVATAALGLGALVAPQAAADPYYPLDGNHGYDVQHYRVVDHYRPGSDRLEGVTVLRATAHRELSSFHLDLVLAPDRVSVDGHRASFTKPSRHELRVVLAHALHRGDTFTVRVRYHGRPATVRAEGMAPNSDLYFHRPGETIAMGEPQNAPWWFAANETPVDKATYDISVLVPKGRQVVSNGELVSRRTRAGWTRWHWRMSDPMVTYLAFFAAGRFHLERGEVDGRPYVYAVSRLMDQAAQDRSMSLLEQTGAVVSWLQSKFGAYPFTSVGGVISGLPLPYALETQSRPVYGYSDGPDAYSIGLLVHEEAHQWFGDDVSLRRWRDVWLNEGFATYAEWLYAQDHGGPSLRDHLREAYDAHPAGDGFWDVQVSDPGPADMWNNPVYVRGAMTLAALGERVGDAAVGTMLRRWAHRRQFGHGTGPAFRRLAEQVTGQDLTAFFGRWLDASRRPADTTANGLGS
ncbi:MAG: hypothetical protein QOK15_3767 [Nocardioidaceae bacterium]|nr:hypothetical protein [Nocardioidaceae bacterium]